MTAPAPPTFYTYRAAQTAIDYKWVDARVAYCDIIHAATGFNLLHSLHNDIYLEKCAVAVCENEITPVGKQFDMRALVRVVMTDLPDQIIKHYIKDAAGKMSAHECDILLCLVSQHQSIEIVAYALDLTPFPMLYQVTLKGMIEKAALRKKHDIIRLVLDTCIGQSRTELEAYAVSMGFIG